MAFSPRRLMMLLSGGSRSCSRSVADALRRISTSSIIQNKNSCSSPWLMLPPKLSSSISYNFYSLAESRVVTLPRGGQLSAMPIDDLRFRGSSHGWLALLNRHTSDLFLYDPVSRRHVDLPPIRHRSTGVTKVTLSSSPDDDNCRAVMIYNRDGVDDALAFCCPGRSKEWNPIGGVSYKDFVYSPRQNLFFGLNKSYEFETWDLTTSDSRMTKTIKADAEKFLDRSGGLVSTGKVEYLVVADEMFSHDEDYVLLVTRFLSDQVLPDGDTLAPLDLYPPTTFGFRIDVYDEREGDIKFFAEESLDGFTLFVGCHSDSVALPAARFPELMPDSIY